MNKFACMLCHLLCPRQKRRQSRPCRPSNCSWRERDWPMTSTTRSPTDRVPSNWCTRTSCPSASLCTPHWVTTHTDALVWHSHTHLQDFMETVNKTLDSWRCFWSKAARLFQWKCYDRKVSYLHSNFHFEKTVHDDVTKSFASSAALQYFVMRLFCHIFTVMCHSCLWFGYCTLLASYLCLMFELHFD